MIYCFKFFRYIYFFLLILFLLSCSVSVNTDDNFQIVELPDGSVVYLNNNSSIQYTKSFNDRNLELIGERITFNRNNNSFKKSKSNQHYKIWLSEFDIEMKALGKDIKKGSKALEKETKKVGKKLKKLIK